MKVFGLGLVLLVGTPANAACGLDHCPPSAAPGGIEPGDVRVLQRVSFLGEAWSHAVTSETNLGGSARITPGVLVGLAVPINVVVQGSNRAMGLGDTLVWFDFARTEGAVRWGAGAQVEVPTAVHPEFADGHFLALPYVRGRYQAGRWDAGARVGFSQVLSKPPRSYENPVGGHVHDGSPISQHADSEVLVRVEAGVSGWVGHRAATGWRVAFRNDLTQVVEKDGSTLATCGPVVELARGRVLGQVFAEFPYTQARRAETRLVTQMSVGWGPAAARRVTDRPVEIR
jgi:hypothetical protein